MRTPRYVTWRTKWASDAEMSTALNQAIAGLGGHWRVHSFAVLMDEVVYLFECVA